MLLLQVLQRGPDSLRLCLGSGSLGPGSGDLLSPNLVQTAKAIRIHTGSSLASCRLLGCGSGGGGGRLGGCEGSAEGLNLVTEIVDLSAGR